MLTMPSHLNTRSPQSLLSDSFLAYMARFSADVDDDIVRYFFRTQVGPDPSICLASLDHLAGPESGPVARGRIRYTQNDHLG